MDPLQPSAHHSWITTAQHSWTLTSWTPTSWTPECSTQLEINCPSQLGSHSHQSWTPTAHHSWILQCPPQLDNNCSPQLENNCPHSWTPHHPSQLDTHSWVPQCPSQAIPQIPRHFGGMLALCPAHLLVLRTPGPRAEPSPGSGEIRTSKSIGCGSLSHGAAAAQGCPLGPG